MSQRSGRRSLVRAPARFEALLATSAHACWGTRCTTPSRGGAEEGARHASRYRATLLAYQHVFGEAPPADIWPAPEARFKERTRHQQPHALGCTQAHRVAERVPHQCGARVAHRACRRCWCLAARRVASPSSPAPGPDFLKLYLLALIALAAFGFGAPRAGGRAAGRAPRACRHDHAYVAGGTQRVVQTALASLAAARRDQRERRGGIACSAAACTPLPAARLAVVDAVLTSPAAAGWCPCSRQVEVRSRLDALHEQLHARGLLTSPRRDERLRDLVDRAHHLPQVVVGWACCASFTARSAACRWCCSSS